MSWSYGISPLIHRNTSVTEAATGRTVVATERTGAGAATRRTEAGAATRRRSQSKWFFFHHGEEFKLVILLCFIFFIYFFFISIIELFPILSCIPVSLRLPGLFSLVPALFHCLVCPSVKKLILINKCFIYNRSVPIYVSIELWKLWETMSPHVSLLVSWSVNGLACLSVGFSKFSKKKTGKIHFDRSNRSTYLKQNKTKTFFSGSLVADLVTVDRSSTQHLTYKYVLESKRALGMT